MTEIYEESESLEDEVGKYQAAINSGMAWRLEGSFGRAAMDYIKAGYCALGEEGHRDYYGNYVPSRDEVKDGTKGSVTYVLERSPLGRVVE